MHPYPYTHTHTCAMLYKQLMNKMSRRARNTTPNKWEKKKKCQPTNVIHTLNATKTRLNGIVQEFLVVTFFISANKIFYSSLLVDLFVSAFFSLFFALSIASFLTHPLLNPLTHSHTKIRISTVHVCLSAVVPLPVPFQLNAFNMSVPMHLKYAIYLLNF